MSMEARIIRAALVAVAAFLSLGASRRTENFIVTAASDQIAVTVAQQAEKFRRDLAIEWLGKELPRWRMPCPIEVKVAPHLGAGGATSFAFDAQGPINWTMSIQGSYERVLDSVLPHEVTHTIFATHFKRPLPRWADEGACTTVEHDSERQKQQQLLLQFLSTNRGIPFNRMFTMTEYPADVIPLYSQGHSLARYLIMIGGKRKFMEYLADGMGVNDPRFSRMHYTEKLPAQVMIQNWTVATTKHYNFKDLSQLQLTWNDWVVRGRPQLPRNPAIMLAADSSAKSPESAGKLATYDPQRGPAQFQTAALQVNNSSESSIPSHLASAATNQSASQVSPDGWRSVHSSAAKTTGVNATSVAGTTYAPGSIRNADAIATTVTRPQPLGRPQQTVLEGTSQGPVPAARTVAAPSNGRSYYAPPQQPGQTMYR